jgi:chromosomal replication initiation ATPase DnaA
MTQPPLPLNLPVSTAQADFVQAPCNANALALISAPRLPHDRLIVTGPQGAGKSHLLAIWARAHGIAPLPADALQTTDLPTLAAQGAVALDQAERCAQAQTQLFHLLNLLAQNGGQILLAARTPPRDWELTLPDLASRLQAMAHVTLGPPDDTLLAAVLAKHFTDRQIRIPDTLIPFLIARMERSLAAAQRLAERLDQEALARGKPITRALAAEILQGEFDL